MCELMIEQTEPLLRDRAELLVRDVDERRDWRDAFGNDVPVMFVDGAECCRHQFDRAALLEQLDIPRGAAQ